MKWQDAAKMLGSLLLGTLALFPYAWMDGKAHGEVTTRLDNLEAKSHGIAADHDILIETRKDVEWIREAMEKRGWTP